MKLTRLLAGLGRVATPHQKSINNIYLIAIAGIKVVCGITPHTDLLPILHDLHQADYPALPDLTIYQDET